jgi:hypothetical protein
MLLDLTNVEQLSTTLYLFMLLETCMCLSTTTSIVWLVCGVEEVNIIGLITV